MARTFRILRSELRKALYRLQFPGVCFGRGVFLGKNCEIFVANGSELKIGASTSVEANVQLSAKGNISIGRNSFVGRGSVIVAVEEICIGEEALIAAYTTIRDQDHQTAPGRAFRNQPTQSKPINIGKNCWLGTHVSVLKGVRIGDDAIIGANAVVTKDVPSKSTAVGVPARIRTSMGN